MAIGSTHATKQPRKHRSRTSLKHKTILIMIWVLAARRHLDDNETSLQKMRKMAMETERWMTLWRMTREMTRRHTKLRTAVSQQVRIPSANTKCEYVLNFGLVLAWSFGM